eukprot:4398757-Pleurochrysis_carterae.AAC.1
MAEPACERATETFSPPTIPLSRGTVRRGAWGGAALDAGADDGVVAGTRHLATGSGVSIGSTHPL